MYLSHSSMLVVVCAEVSSPLVASGEAGSDRIIEGWSVLECLVVSIAGVLIDPERQRCAASNKS